MLITPEHRFDRDIGLAHDILFKGSEAMFYAVISSSAYKILYVAVSLTGVLPEILLLPGTRACISVVFGM